MNIFWENILRYPRFLISSILGLIFVLFNNLFKTIKKNTVNKFFFIFFAFLFLLIFFFIFCFMFDLY